MLKFIVICIALFFISGKHDKKESKTLENTGSKIHFNAMAPLHVMYYNDRSKLEEDDWELFGRQLDEGAEMGLDAISVDVWWGFAEGNGDNQFEWEYYHRIFREITERGLDLIPILSFHAFDPGPKSAFRAPVPLWIWKHLLEGTSTLSEIDLKYMSEDRGENDEPLYSEEFVSLWADDLVMPQYREFMDAFILEFRAYVDQMQEINVSCGPSGELRYPSYSRHDGGKYPNRGRFQCYSSLALQDYQYWLKNHYASIDELNNAWGSTYSDYEEIELPKDLETLFSTGAFRKGRRALDLITWYNEALMRHGNRMIQETLEAFSGKDSIQIGFKIPGIHWRIADPVMPRSAEIICGLIDAESLDGTAAYQKALSKAITDLPVQSIILHFTCIEQGNGYGGSGPSEHYSRALDLVHEVGAAAQRLGLKLKGENAGASGLYNDKGWDRMESAISDGGYAGVTILRLGDVTTQNPLGNQRYTQLIKKFK